MNVNDIRQAGFSADVAKQIANTADSPETKVVYLQRLREALDAGQIAVSDYVKIAQPLAQRVNDDLFTLGGQGRGGSQRANAVRQTFESTTGFIQNPQDRTKVQVNLPQQFEQKVREELLPSNLTPEQRQRYLDEIPNDIGFDTGRFELEREGIRQQIQQEEAAKQQKTSRTQNLQDLAKLLAEGQDASFKRSIPILAEQANTKGIYRSTGFGDSLAREYSDLTQQTDQALALKGLEYNDLDTAAIMDALNTKRSFQSSGLDREFSLEDYTRQLNDTLRVAKESAPQPQGKSGTDKAIAIGSGVMGGLQTGAQAYSGIQAGRASKAGMNKPKV